MIVSRLGKTTEKISHFFISRFFFNPSSISSAVYKKKIHMKESERRKKLKLADKNLSKKLPRDQASRKP
jgi:hypothetical protein